MSARFEGNNSSIVFKESKPDDKHENFLYDMAEIARKNGTNVKDEKSKIASTLYHEPESNLIVVSMVNEGK